MFKTLPESVTDVKQISQQNFTGLSNTGIRLDALSMEFLDSLKDCTSPVFDWYLFTRILLEIGHGKLVESVSTIYRIYDGNIAGESRDLNKEYNVKQKHYQMLAQRYEYFKNLANKLESLNPEELKPAINHQGYWWSDIQMEE